MKNKWILLLVLFTMLFANFNISSAWLFDNPQTWDYSVNLNPDDHLNTYLRLIPTTQSTLMSPLASKAWHSMVDMNGDGLIDILLYIDAFHGATQNGYNTFRYSAVLYNKWDYTFGIWYKCAEQYNSYVSVTVPMGFYGDCAQ